MSVLDDIPQALIDAYTADFLAMGLPNPGQLAMDAASFLGDNPSESETTLWLESQPVYRERFAAVFDRRDRIAAGENVAPISTAQQLEAERGLRELEAMYGVPSGTVDVREMFAGDNSVNEMYARAALAQNDAEAAYNTAEGRAVIDQLLGTPGIQPGHIVAFYLDPDLMMPELTRATQAAQVASAASRVQFSLTVEESLALRDAGIDPGSVQQRAAALSSAGDTRFGVGGEFEAMSREQETGYLAGSTTATTNLNRRAETLQARFGGGGGFSTRQGGGVAGLGSA